LNYLYTKTKTRQIYSILHKWNLKNGVPGIRKWTMFISTLLACLILKTCNLVNHLRTVCMLFSLCMPLLSEPYSGWRRMPVLFKLDFKMRNVFLHHTEEEISALEQLYLRQVAATNAGIHRCTFSALKTLHAFRIDGEACFLVIYDISRAKLSQYLELLSRSLEVVECRPLTVEAEIEDVLLQLNEQRVKHLNALYNLLNKTDSNCIPIEQYRILRLKLAQVFFYE
ncbi:hypothetical protein T4E_8115, partial [Trichinella pseudospiralis]